MRPQTIGHARRALQFVIWGVLLRTFALWFSQTTNGVGFRFDLLNDAAGSLLIAIGAWRLAAVFVSERYRRLAGFVRLAAALAILPAIDGHFIRPLAPGTVLAWQVVAILSTLGMAAFFLAMSLLWRWLRPPTLAIHWRWAGIGALLGLALDLALRFAGFWNSLFVAENAAPGIRLNAPATLLLTGLVLAPWALGLVTLGRCYWALRSRPAGEIIPPLIEPGGGPRRWPPSAAAAGLALIAALGGLAGYLALRQPPPARILGQIKANTFPFWGNGASFSPDGARILSQDDGAPLLYDAASLRPRQPIVQESNIIDQAYDPTGQRIAIMTETTLRIWDTGTGQVIGECPAPLNHFAALRYSPDGRLIAWVSFGELFICDPGSDQPVRNFQYTANDSRKLRLGAFAYSPESRFIALSYYDRLAIFDIALGRPVYTIDSPDSAILDVAWSPDGSRLATIHEDGVARIWDRWGTEPIREIAPIRRIDGLLGRYERTSRFNDGVLAWSPDSSRLALALDHGPAGVWDATTGAQRWRLAGHSKPIISVEWHPDGRRV
ncbi:MAG TPA: hypothetical protein VD886_22835, partial [Herpetosiphonaceae bacterium]|nr:hypothetical protein [Herpetosiphonaceae bacterium]